MHERSRIDLWTPVMWAAVAAACSAGCVVTSGDGDGDDQVDAGSGMGEDGGAQPTDPDNGVDPTIDAGPGPEPEPDGGAAPEPDGGPGPEADGGSTPDTGPIGELQPVECEGEPTELSDNISSDTALEAGCYRVTSTIVISGGTLTVAPGTTFLFTQGTAFSVRSDGALNARGTLEAPIAFTGVQETRGFWRGLEFRGTGLLDNVLDYVVVQHAGSSAFSGTGTTPAGIALTTSGGTPSVAITNSLIQENAGFGLYLSSATAERNFSGNVLTANASGAASVSASTVHRLDGSSTYVGNDDDLVEVSGNSVSSDVTWPAIDARYRMHGTTQLYAHLTIEAGALLSFTQNAAFRVRRSGGDVGALTAEGTESAPIVLTGEQETRGFWQGLSFEGTNRSENSLDHVVVEYGGSSAFAGTGTTPANIVLTTSNGTPSVAIKNTTSRQSAGYGLYLPGTVATRDFSSNTLTENESGAAYVHTSTIRNLDATSSYTGNDEDVVVVSGNTAGSDGTWPAIDAEYEMHGTSQIRAHVTIEPGATLAFTQGAALRVRGATGDVGALTAEGTGESPITFTGVQQTRGFWQGIQFESTNQTENVFDHVVVEYGGESAFSGTSSTLANVALTGTSRLALTNSILRESNGYGIFVHGDTTMQPAEWDTAAGNAFPDNELGGIAP